MVENVAVNFFSSRCGRVVKVQRLLIGSRIDVAINGLGGWSGGHGEACGEKEER